MEPTLIDPQAIARIVQEHLTDLSTDSERLLRAGLDTAGRTPQRSGIRRYLALSDPNVRDAAMVTIEQAALFRGLVAERHDDRLEISTYGIVRLTSHSTGAPSLAADLTAIQVEAEGLLAQGLSEPMEPRFGVVGFVTAESADVSMAEMTPWLPAQVQRSLAPTVNDEGQVQVITVIGADSCTFSQVLTYTCESGVVNVPFRVGDDIETFAADNDYTPEQVEELRTEIERVQTNLLDALTQPLTVAA